MCAAKKTPVRDEFPVVALFNFTRDKRFALQIGEERRWIQRNVRRFSHQYYIAPHLLLQYWVVNAAIYTQALTAELAATEGITVQDVLDSPPQNYWPPDARKGKQR